MFDSWTERVFTRHLVVVVVAPSAFMCAAQHGIGEIFACFVWQNQIIQTCETIIFVFLLVKLSVPTQPGWRKTELLRQQSFQDTSLSLSPFFNMQLQNIWLLTVKAVILHLHTNYFQRTHSLENMCNSSRYIIAYMREKDKCVNKKSTKHILIHVLLLYYLIIAPSCIFILTLLIYLFLNCFYCWEIQSSPVCLF